jgi:hypothetical protein
MEYLGAWVTLIHEKKLRSKISCQTPFKVTHSTINGTGSAAGLAFVLLILFSGFLLPVLNGAAFCGVDGTVVA